MAHRSRPDPQTVFQHALEASLAAGELGLQIAVYKEGEPVANVWGGHLDEAMTRPVAEDTLFNTFSTCKGWTNTALHIQAERGLVDYNQPIAEYWPEFAANGKERTTVRHMLSHQGGLPLMPDGVTPQTMADYEWMVTRLAAMPPLYEAGTRNGYHSYTQGWYIAEIVRRTDPQRRPFGQFIQDEICRPLGIRDMYLGIPDAAEPRVATLYGRGASAQNAHLELFVKSMPLAVDTSPDVWGLPVVRRACIPGAGGITCASQHVKFWAMLANGGAFNGVQLLSPERIRGFSYPRPNQEPDFILGIPQNVSTLGYYLAGTPAVAGSSPHIIAQPGAGMTIGWADPDNNLAVAVAHNRFGLAYTQPVIKAVEEAFGIV